MERGPFDKFQSPWYTMEPKGQVIDRRDEPWPWYPKGKQVPEQSATPMEMLKLLSAIIEGETIPPVTSLSRDAGAKDIGWLSESEVLKTLGLNTSKGE